MEALHDVIARSEDWLLQRVLRYAGDHGYTAYTSTLAEAWRASIAGLSAPIMDALKNHEAFRPLQADGDCASDPMTRFGVEEARKHRGRGITFVLFLGLMKYYRQAYVDLVQTVAAPEAAEWRSLIDNYFDRIELGLSAEWMSAGEPQLVDELRQANVRITNEKNKFLTILESLPTPVLFIDRSNRVATLNRAAAALFYGREPASELYSGADLEVPAVLAPEVDQFGTGTAGTVTFAKDITTVEGTTSFIVMMQRMLDVSGKFNGTVVIVNDVSALKRLEEEIEELNTDLAERAYQLEQANQELETFNYSVSHDLRTPLTGISGYCQLLLGSCGHLLDAQCTEYVNEIFRICMRMNQQITTMLNFSRLSKCELEREQVDMTLIARSIAAALRLEGPERSVEFEVEPGVTAWGDPRLLRLVLENLLGNAWKFTAKRRQARIEFGTRREGEELVYFVRDNGAGFDMSWANTLFLPFQRLHDREEYRGFGVGLATVDRIIGRHGGKVWAEGEPEKGATISFTLPEKP